MDSSEVNDDHDDDDAFLFQEVVLNQTSPTIIDNNDCSWADQMIGDHDADDLSIEFSTTPNVANSPLFLDIYDFGQQQPKLILESCSDHYITSSTNYNPDSLISPEEYYYCGHQHQLGDQVETTSTTASRDHDHDDQTAANTLIFNSSSTADHHHTTDNNNNSAEQQLDGDNFEEETADDLKLGALNNCKNLVSERNRRKRLGQQLLALRALVPNITKMDKRSVLVDALNYLRSIHEETARLQKELKQSRFISNLRDRTNNTNSRQYNTIEAHHITRMLPSASAAKSRAVQITQIETEKIEDRRFVVKMTCKGSIGVGGDVLRVFESLGFEITYTSLQQMRPQEMNTTMFIRVRKPGKMTEEKLKDCITSMALRTGLILQCP